MFVGATYLGVGVLVGRRVGTVVGEVTRSGVDVTVSMGAILAPRT